MSLLGDGKAAMAAMVKEAALFPRIKPADWSAAAVKLAKKQVIAAGLTAKDLRTIRSAIGAPVFERTLNDLTAFQAKLLAKRIDPTVTPEEIASKAMALAIIQDRLRASTPSQGARPADGEAREPAGDADAESAPKANPYLGRKAFRVR